MFYNKDMDTENLKERFNNTLGEMDQELPFYTILYTSTQNYHFFTKFLKISIKKPST